MHGLGVTPLPTTGNSLKSMYMYKVVLNPDIISYLLMGILLAYLGV